jgi:hypothetical protein
LKKLQIFLLSSVLLGIVLIGSFIYFYLNKPYTEVIKANWSISLPKPYKEVYSTNSGESFHGDGERYSIFEYKNKEDIDLSLNWDNNENEAVNSAIIKTIESEIIEVINGLSIPMENMPDFKSKYKYYTTQKNDFSKIYLIFVPDTKKLYVIEYFL